MTHGAPGVYGLPNNHQTPISPDKDSTSKHKLISPFPNSDAMSLSTPHSFNVFKNLG